VAAKTFAEYMKQENVDAQIWLLLQAVWDAATEAAVEKFTSTNSQSDAIANLRKTVVELQSIVKKHQSYVDLHTPLGR
jgi:hypothetical protein